MRYGKCIAFFYGIKPYKAHNAKLSNCFKFHVSHYAFRDFTKKEAAASFSFLLAFFVQAAFLHSLVAARAFFFDEFEKPHDLFRDLFVCPFHSFVLS